MVRLVRGSAVPDNFWTALPVRLGARARRYDSETMQVPVEGFLAARAWLRAHCISYSVSITFDDSLRALLQRAVDEHAEVARLTSSQARTHPTTGPGDRRAGRFVRALREFQRRDLEKLLALSHGANFSVPGAGKTAVAYATYEAERQRGRVDRLLIIGPISSFDLRLRCLDRESGDQARKRQPYIARRCHNKRW